MQGKRLERVNQLVMVLFGVSPQRFGYTFMAVACGYMSGAYLSARLVVRLGPVRTLGIGMSVAVLGAEDMWVASFTALESARGFIWSALRKNLDLRVTPQLLFRPDRSMEHAARMSALLAGLHAGERAPVEDDD